MRVFFENGTVGKLFFRVDAPGSVAEARGLVVFIPAFGEEQNKCRRTVSIAARQFAQAGYESWIYDLYGTGDSAGEFSEARWSVWLADTEQLLNRQFADRLDGKCVIIGVRFGALLALEAFSRCVGQVDSIVMWQPVLSGTEELKQLQRLEKLSGALGGQVVRAQVDSDENADDVEIGGYEISRDFIGDLEYLDLEVAASKIEAPIHWIEVVSPQMADMPARRSRVAGSILNGQASRQIHKVVDERFWATAEISVGSSVIGLTKKLIEGQ